MNAEQPVVVSVRFPANHEQTVVEIQNLLHGLGMKCLLRAANSQKLLQSQPDKASQGLGIRELGFKLLSIEFLTVDASGNATGYGSSEVSAGAKQRMEID